MDDKAHQRLVNFLDDARNLLAGRESKHQNESRKSQGASSTHAVCYRFFGRADFV